MSSKIKFSLIDSYCCNGGQYALTFTIHEQDLSWNKNTNFQSSNGLTISTNYYSYIGDSNNIYLISSKILDENEKGFKGNSSTFIFDTHKLMLEHKKKILTGLKEWSNGT